MLENPDIKNTQLNHTVGIIAGSGRLPISVAEAVVKAGGTVFICALEGYGDPDLEKFPHKWISVGAIGQILKQLKSANCKKVVMIGHVKRIPISKIIPDFGVLLNAREILKIVRGGDGKLLSGLADFMETKGFSVVGAHELIPESLIGEGAAGRIVHTAEDYKDIAKGFNVLEAIGNLDVGQAVVVCAGYVLAVEAAEGTDEMLRRVAKLREDGVVHHKGGVLVKVPKVGQDMRFDMPVIGPVTVELVAQAGLSGIVVQAKGVLCHDRVTSTRRADELGVFIEGIILPGSGKASI